MGMGGQCHARTTLPLRKKPFTHCVGGWVGPRAGLKLCGKSRLHRDMITALSNPGRFTIPTTLSQPTTTTALKCDCLIYVLCLQKNPVYLRPWLGFKFFCLQVSLIVDIAYSIRIVNYLGKCGIILIIQFCN
jgi:hypothetical protein